MEAGAFPPTGGWAAHRAVFRRGCTVRTQARRSTLIAGRRSILSGDPHVKQAKQTEEGRSRAHCLNNEGSLARETLLVTKEAPRRRQCTGGRPLDAHIFQCCVPACTASAGLVRSPENFCAHSPGRPRRQVWRSRRGPPNKYNTALARWRRASTPQLHHGSGEREPAAAAGGLSEGGTRPQARPTPPSLGSCCRWASLASYIVGAGQRRAPPRREAASLQQAVRTPRRGPLGVLCPLND